MNRKAIIFGIKGTKLSLEEKIFFKEKKTMGYNFIFKKYCKFNTIKESC